MHISYGASGPFWDDTAGEWLNAARSSISTQRSASGDYDAAKAGGSI
ncbi:MAG: hypothetical protein ACT4OF_06810 [Caulobacteraceae bacterium]